MLELHVVSSRPDQKGNRDVSGPRAWFGLYL